MTHPYRDLHQHIAILRERYVAIPDMPRRHLICDKPRLCNPTTEQCGIQLQAGGARYFFHSEPSCKPGKSKALMVIEISA
jgi:hypothetical protein